MKQSLSDSFRRKSKFNIYELNLIVILTGYPIISFLPDFLHVESRQISVPFRFLVLLLSICVLFIGAKNKTSYEKTIVTRLLIVFLVLYILKMFFNLIWGPEFNYALSNEEYIFWSVGGCFIPMLSVEFIKKIDFVKVAKRTIYILFAVLVLSLFNNKEALANTIENRLDANSSLNSITYGHLGVTLSLLSIYFLELKGNKLFYILTFILGAYIMLISGSRSPVVAFVLCLIVLALVRRNKWVIGALIISVVIIVTSLTIFISFIKGINPVIVDRITAFITENNKSDERSILYKDAIDDFLQYPITGKHFLLSHGIGAGYYPHNLVIEAFMALGLIGGCFFLYLIFMALKVCLLFLKRNYTFSWISLLFIQSLTLGLASGALWAAQAFWVLMMLLFAIHNKRLKLKQQNSFNKKLEKTLQL
jgi:hypothetical protein